MESLVYITCHNIYKEQPGLYILDITCHNIYKEQPGIYILYIT